MAVAVAVGVAPVMPTPKSLTLSLWLLSKFICRKSCDFTALVGMNATMIEHMAPGASVVPQVVPSSTKGAGTVIVMPVAAGPFSLVMVTVCGELVVPTVTVPKSSDFGVAASFAGAAACAVADPIKARRTKRVSVRVTSTDNLDRIIGRFLQKTS